MIFFKFLKFFNNQAKLLIIVISINYFLIFIISFFEIFFISTIYLILNFDADFIDTSKLTTVLINFLDYLSAFFDLNFLNMKIIFFVFIITLKNFLTIFQNWFFKLYLSIISEKI